MLGRRPMTCIQAYSQIDHGKNWQRNCDEKRRSAMLAGRGCAGYRPPAPHSASAQALSIQSTLWFILALSRRAHHARTRYVGPPLAV
ncbi:hypothetical protein DL89DRAFT_95336 [Linderina pennispora]|uniref:Uncharacterized protein n=1 Tax=Linderina pennispora TaxID=61395 RepID=A0A1Y1VWY0_9FUNG|nr:uncharacterized protein DL89DRAFT_95336 [Linderina pennispora]ORX65782.1 hypothetical protein DL89DRAFT_95336 [Linderina pennispora]